MPGRLDPRVALREPVASRSETHSRRMSSFARGIELRKEEREKKKRSGTCAQTRVPIWAQVTGDTFLHGNVKQQSAQKYCGAEESGRHKMARKP